MSVFGRPHFQSSGTGAPVSTYIRLLMLFWGTTIAASQQGNTMCWSTVTSASETRQIGELSNEAVAAQAASGEPLQMSPLCFDLAEFIVERPPLDTPWQDTVYAGAKLETKFRFQAPVEELTEVLGNSTNWNGTIWVRMFACNTQQVGFCHPFADAMSWDSIQVLNVEDPGNGNDAILQPTGTDTSWATTITTPFLQADVPQFTTEFGLEFMEASKDVGAVIPFGVDGQYIFVGHATVQLQVDSLIYRVDMATSVPDGLLQLESSSPPRVLRVTQGAKVLVGFIVGIGGAITLGVFAFIVYYRNHRVITMAQGGLLGWMAACSFLSVMFSVFNLPTRDVFCQLNSIVLIPVSMTASILIGRLFRVYSTLSTVSKLGRNSSSNSSGLSTRARRRRELMEEKTMKFLSFLAFTRCCRRGRKRQSPALRQATSRKDTVRLILVLSMPQIAFQIFEFAYFESKLILEYDREYLTGREVCDDDGFKWVKFLGTLLVVLQYILVVFVAWCSRELPTAFNETSQIFRAATINGIVSSVIIGMLALFDVPDTSPSLAATLTVLLLVVLAIVPVWVVVAPKIRRVLSGEKVVISNMLREMNNVAPSMPGTPISGLHTDHGHPKPPTSVHSTLTVSHHNPASSMQWKDSEALPNELETEIYRLDEVISLLKSKCESGRPIEEKELLELKEATSAVSSQVNLFSFDTEAAGGNGAVSSPDGGSAVVRNSDARSTESVHNGTSMETVDGAGQIQKIE